MYTKDEIGEFCNRIVRDRSLRINKDLLTGICEQAKQAVDLQLCMVPNNGRTIITVTNLDEAIAAFEEVTGFMLPRVLPREMLTNLEDPENLKSAFENLIAAGLAEKPTLDGLTADEMSLDEILDNPLSSVPDSGTIVAGGNPECDTQTQKSKQPSSAKAKPPQQ